MTYDSVDVTDSCLVVMLYMPCLVPAVVSKLILAVLQGLES